MGSNSDIYLSDGEVRSYLEILRDLQKTTKICKALLTRSIQEQIDVETIQGRLSFHLVDYIDPFSNTATLKKDFLLFARFKAACRLITKSARDMDLHNLDDSGQAMKKCSDNVVLEINRTLKIHDVDPPEKPDFSNLEEKLNKKTEEFLHILDIIDGQDTKCDDTKLMYLVRNYFITSELGAMAEHFRNKITGMVNPKS